MDPQAVPPAAAPMPPEATEISARLKRILAFPGFAAAARRTLLLRYIVEKTLAGEGERITEYGIGLDVFGLRLSTPASIP